MQPNTAQQLHKPRNHRISKLVRFLLRVRKRSLAFLWKQRYNTHVPILCPSGGNLMNKHKTLTRFYAAALLGVRKT